MSKLSDLYAQYPSLSESAHRITSPDADDYNCVAWVERELDHWYEPGIYWPDDVPNPEGDHDLDCYVALFEKWGFTICEGPSLESGFLKIAIYADGKLFQHVAKQLRDGSWSSKAGVLHDFRHEDLGALHPSGIMRNARPVVFMKRVDDGRDTMEVEHTGLNCRSPPIVSRALSQKDYATRARAKRHACTTFKRPRRLEPNTAL